MDVSDWGCFHRFPLTLFLGQHTTPDLLKPSRCKEHFVLPGCKTVIYNITWFVNWFRWTHLADRIGVHVFFFVFKLGRDTDNQPSRQRYPNQQVKKVGNKEEKRLKTRQEHYDKNQKSPRQRRCGTGRNDRTKDTAWINQLREDNETQVQHIRAEQVIINLTGSGNETRQEESDQNYNRERAGNVENNSSCDNWIHTKWSHPLLVFN